MIGERVRQLRIARGLTQTELARGRFTKEYVSQIERGRARPSGDALEWLAQRLGVARSYLESGISSHEHERAHALLARAEAALQAAEAAEALRCVQMLTEIGDSDPLLELRKRLAEAAARADLGDVQAALDLLEDTRWFAERPDFTEVDRAAVLFQIGRCRYKVSSVPAAVAHFTAALDELHQVGLEGDPLRARILRWRSRCHRRQRDWQSAREDVEGALELARRLDDRRGLAHGYFQASLIAEREGRWVHARALAERAKALYEEHDDRLSVGRLLNNLGALAFLLGDADQAVGLLKDAFRVALEADSQADAAQAVSSLAQVHLRRGEFAEAEEQARHALRLLTDRVDFTDEIGNAQLVLGRALLEQGRVDEAERALADSGETFTALGSASHRAAVWIAQAELAIRRGDESRALQLYRAAAETLQDFRF
jgi:tetratricopeptide (TPR) repeat protein